MKAIHTRYHGPTNFKGSRIVATAEGGKRPHRMTVPYDHALNLDENHAAAAKALKSRLDWKGKMVGGTDPHGDMVWVFSEGSIHINPRRKSALAGLPRARYEAKKSGRYWGVWDNRHLVMAEGPPHASRATAAKYAAIMNAQNINKNPRRKARKSRRKASPAQLRARAKFAAMARARAGKRKAKRNPRRRKPVGAPKMRHYRTKGTRFKSKRPYREQTRMVQRRLKAARFRKLRRNPTHVVLQLVRRDGSRWYISRSNQLTTVKADAIRFATERGAMAAAEMSKGPLGRMGFVRAHTVRA